MTPEDTPTAASPPQKETFTDPEGREWRPRVTTPVLLALLDHSKLTIDDLMAFRIPLNSILELVWLACRTRAESLNVSRDEFFERVLTPDLIAPAGAAVWGSIRAAFPQLADMKIPTAKSANEYKLPGLEDLINPLDNGDGKTSSN